MDASPQHTGCLLDPQVNGWGLVATGHHARLNIILAHLVKHLGAGGISVSKTPSGSYALGVSACTADISLAQMAEMRRLPCCMDVSINTTPEFELRLVVSSASGTMDDCDAPAVAASFGTGLMDQLAAERSGEYSSVLAAARSIAKAGTSNNVQSGM